MSFLDSLVSIIPGHDLTPGFNLPNNALNYNFTPTGGISGGNPLQNFSTGGSNGTPQQINQIPLGGSGGGAQTLAATTGGSDGGYSAAELAQQAANNQAIGNINSAIGRLGTQQASGNQGIDNAYNTALQQLLLGKNQGELSYNQGKQTNATNYVQNKNAIGANAGEALNGIQRLLGSRGAGGSSAYNTVAPGAVARGATLQRADAGQNFGANQQGLDTNWNQYMTGYNNSVTGAGAQRDEQKRTLNDSITQNNASLLQQLASLQAGAGNSAGAQPYLDQANSLLDRLATSAPAQINYNTQAYTPPSISSYSATPTSTSYNQQNGGDYFSPFLQTLLGKKQPSLA
jgi:hypothetical protein